MIYREQAKAASAASHQRTQAMLSFVIDRERLARLLGMLGSDHLGERDNAARAAHRLVQQHGITWFDVVVTYPPPDTDDPDTTRQWSAVAGQ
jgi:hypothetical protein